MKCVRFFFSNNKSLLSVETLTMIKKGREKEIGSNTPYGFSISDGGKAKEFLFRYKSINFEQEQKSSMETKTSGKEFGIRYMFFVWY